MLRLDRLSVGYKGTRGTVLGGLDVEVAPGSFVCVLGRNGAGKSTLMRTLSGLQPALEGRAMLDDEDVAAMRPQTRARRIAVVLTERSASPGLTVADVVSLGRQPFTGWQGRLTGEDEAIVAEALTAAGAAGFARRLFDDLSDGERQRVLIARAVAQSPRLMILDEITAFLDLPGRVETMALLHAHARRTGAVVLLSSHDLDLSLQLADTLWLVDPDAGLQVGSAAKLIGQGAISRAFDTDAVRFCSESQRFELMDRGIRGPDPAPDIKRHQPPFQRFEALRSKAERPNRDIGHLSPA